MDELDEMIRDAKPGRAHRSMPLTPRAEEGLLRILEEDDDELALARKEVRRVPRHRARRLALVGAFAVVALVAVVVGVVTLRPTVAIAATPPVLASTPVGGTPSALLENLAAIRSEGSPADAATAPFTVTSYSWNLDGLSGDGLISTTRTEETFFADGHVERTDAIGDPQKPGDAAVVPERFTPTATLDSRDDDYSGAEAGPAIPTDPAEIPAFLASQHDEDGTSTAWYLGAIASVLDARVPSAAEEASLLRFAATLDRLTVEGEVTDRLGRDGIAFSADDRGNGDEKALLIVSPETGQILATELEYVGDSRTDIASPAVTYYEAWER